MHKALELPTLVVAAAVHIGWFLLTYAAARATGAIALFVLAPAAAFVVAWHGSLQHEVIHGHPTKRAWVNTLLASLPLGLWMPFEIYREMHLAHHRSDLTDPERDPESFYVTAAWWERAGRIHRMLARTQTAALGRLALGPFLIFARFIASEWRLVARGELRHLRAWALHALGLALVWACLSYGAGLSIGRYLLVFAYPGFALTLVRSFAEHRPAEETRHRSAIVETGRIASLLYLNNNLHAVHHESPALPWYELPSRYRARRDAILAGNGGFLVPGYIAVLRAHGLRAKDSVIHPHASERGDAVPADLDSVRDLARAGLRVDRLA
jgi:fatty acid desaturase